MGQKKMRIGREGAKGGISALRTRANPIASEVRTQNRGHLSFVSAPASPSLPPPSTMDASYSALEVSPQSFSLTYSQVELTLPSETPTLSPSAAALAQSLFSSSPSFRPSIPPSVLGPTASIALPLAFASAFYFTTFVPPLPPSSFLSLFARVTDTGGRGGTG